MFEKEAEESSKKAFCIAHSHEDELIYRNGFQQGAEFGYNKAKGEVITETTKNYNAIIADYEKHYKERIAELEKANEWHFVSKEGFPNKDDIYLIIRSNGLHLGDYCCGGDGDIDCQSWCDYPSEEEIQDDSVIAWKEIVLPELKESE